jgi:hypothetical protein
MGFILMVPMDFLSVGGLQWGNNLGCAVQTINNTSGLNTLGNLILLCKGPNGVEGIKEIRYVGNHIVIDGVELNDKVLCNVPIDIGPIGI